MTILLKDEDWEGINQRCEFDVVDIIINLDDLYSKSEQMEMVVKRCNETAKAQAKKLWEELERQVFYVDARGFIALKPNATKNWLTFKKEIEE